jgi:hypothetical protein
LLNLKSDSFNKTKENLLNFCRIHSCPKEIEFILNTVNLIDALNLLKPNKLNPLTPFSWQGEIKGG